jgi:hypothetical protein
VLTGRGMANDADTFGSPLPGSMVPPRRPDGAIVIGGFAAIVIAVVGPACLRQHPAEGSRA